MIMLEHGVTGAVGTWDQWFESSEATRERAKVKLTRKNQTLCCEEVRPRPRTDREAPIAYEERAARSGTCPCLRGRTISSASTGGAEQRKFGGRRRRKEAQLTSIAEVEPKLEALRVHHPLAEKQGVEMQLLVDEELTSFLLPFVATGYADHAPDGVVGRLYELEEYRIGEEEEKRRG